MTDPFDPRDERDQEEDRPNTDGQKAEDRSEGERFGWRADPDEADAEERPLHLAGDSETGPTRIAASKDEEPTDSAAPPLETAFAGFGGEVTSSETAPPDDRPPLPTWERVEEEGLATGLFYTVKEVLLEPAQTFVRMPRTRKIGWPLVFALIWGTIGIVVSQAYQLLQMAMFPKSMEQIQTVLAEFGIPHDESRVYILGSIIGMMVLSPLLVILQMFIWSGVTHVLLMLVGGANRGFEVTFRTLCYVKGATAILLFLPFCGQYIVPVWAVVCGAIGLSRTQETRLGRAVFALVLPLALCCLCGAVLGGLAAMNNVMGLNAP